jgi:hypothetical protein
MSRALTTAAILAVSVSAAHAGVITGKCDGSKCDTFEVVEQSQVKADAIQGERLILARIKSWVQDGDKRTEETDETGYVFCSARRPAMLVQDNGQTLVKFLAPSARSDVENNINLYANYYEVCHSKGGDLKEHLDNLAKQLDYKVSRTTSTDLKEANKPESVFWWTTPDVKIARPVFLQEPTKAAQLPPGNTDQPPATGSIKEPTTASPPLSSPSIDSADPRRRERTARAKAEVAARRVAAVRARERYIAAVKARERYAASTRQDRYQASSGRGEAAAYSEPAQRVIYVPVRQQSQGLFGSLFDEED